MEVIIKKATLKDAAVANQFLTKLIHDEKQYDENINENCIVSNCYENFMENENNCILLAIVGNKIVGYLYGYIVDNGDAYLEKVSMLEAMFIEQEYRLQQIGHKLIQEFKNWSRHKKARYMELKVCAQNEIARSLYQKEGFHVVKYVMTTKLEEEK